MNRRITISLIIGTLCICLLASLGYTQGDNSPDPLVNLGCLPDAVVTGSVAEEDAGGKHPDDILWDPSTNDYKKASSWHEYGQAYMLAQGGITKENPMWWSCEWPTAKNVNYITCAGVYGNQPQPTTAWSIQIMVDGEWQDLAKAHNGWDADTLRGQGFGSETQTNWLWDGKLVWKGLEPVVTKGVRFTVYANPDSLADDHVSSADSVISFSWTGRTLGPGKPKAVLIQYLNFSGAEADNKMDDLINLALLEEAVVSANIDYVAGSPNFHEGRGQPIDVQYDLIKGDYHNKNTAWGEFGYAYDYEVGYPEEPDEGFQYIVEWPVPKMVNYYAWGGIYGNQPQPDTPWELDYWDGTEWVTLIDGIGGEFADGDTTWPYTPGVSSDAFSIWMSEEPVTTTKMRLAAWSDGITPLWSFVIRCRGGDCISNQDADIPFKACLVQYKEDLSGPSAVKSGNFVRPTEYVLHQNYPNPFNPETTIKFNLVKNSDVRLSVYNIAGQEVAVVVDEMKSQGIHTVKFDASSLTSGVYFYKLKTNQGLLTKKMLLLR